MGDILHHVASGVVHEAYVCGRSMVAGIVACHLGSPSEVLFVSLIYHP